MAAQLAAEPDYPIPPLNPTYQVYPYQIEAHEWMESRETEVNLPVTETDYTGYTHGIRGGIIKMEMGLGKTLTLLYHTFAMQQKRRERFPTLVVASKTVMREWIAQGIEKFYPDTRVVYFHKDFMGDRVRTITAAELRGANLVFTTYDVLLMIYRRNELLARLIEQRANEFAAVPGRIQQINRRERPDYNPMAVGDAAIYNMPWERMACDESQRFANYKTKTYKSIMAIYSRWTWCLTGTPIRNTAEDIWSQLRFCRFAAIAVPRRWDGNRSYRTYNLGRFVYVRDYADVGVVIPERHDHVYEVNMCEQQRTLYGAYLQLIRDMFLELAANTTNLMAILAVFTRLRQTAIAPYIIVRPKRRGTEVKDEVLRNVAKINTDAGNQGFLLPLIRVKVYTKIINRPRFQGTLNIFLTLLL